MITADEARQACVVAATVVPLFSVSFLLSDTAKHPEAILGGSFAPERSELLAEVLLGVYLLSSTVCFLGALLGLMIRPNTLLLVVVLSSLNLAGYIVTLQASSYFLRRGRFMVPALVFATGTLFVVALDCVLLLHATVA